MTGISGIGNAFQSVQAIQRQQAQQPHPQPEPQQQVSETAPAATYSSEADYNPHVMTLAGGSEAAESQAAPPQQFSMR